MQNRFLLNFHKILKGVIWETMGGGVCACTFVNDLFARVYLLFKASCKMVKFLGPPIDTWSFQPHWQLPSWWWWRHASKIMWVWSTPLITVTTSVRATIHKQLIKDLEKLKIFTNEIKALMKHLHQNVIKYLTYLVLNKGMLDNKQPPVDSP